MASPTTYFTPRFVNTRSTNKTMPKSPPEDIQSSVNSVLHTISRRMKPATRPVSAPARTWKSELVKPRPTPVPEVVLVKRATPIKKSGNRTVKSITKLSLPQVKAQLQVRKQQIRRLSQSVAPKGVNNYTNQQRIKEVLRQRRLLEEMMLQYKKLQRDRQSVVLEIHSMRGYLNDIRDKVDGSLRKLNTKRPICDRVNYPTPRAVMAPPKKSTLAQKRY